MGRLTTHVLDVTRGRPGAGISVELYAREAGERRVKVKSTVTNSDGRTDEPLLEGAELVPGVWELEFAIGDYFAGADLGVADPPFLGQVVLRFGISDPERHYHVPLLVSPWSYSTYRGS